MHPAGQSLHLLSGFQGTSASVHFANTCECLGLDSGDPVAGREGAIAAARQPRSKVEQRKRLCELSFIDVNERVSRYSTRPEIKSVSLLARRGSHGVTVCCLDVVAAVEEYFTGQLKEVASETAQASVYCRSMRLLKRVVEHRKLPLN